MRKRCDTAAVHNNMEEETLVNAGHVASRFLGAINKLLLGGMVGGTC